MHGHTKLPALPLWRVCKQYTSGTNSERLASALCRRLFPSGNASAGSSFVPSHLHPRVKHPSFVVLQINPSSNDTFVVCVVASWHRAALGVRKPTRRNQHWTARISNEVHALPSAAGNAVLPTMASSDYKISRHVNMCCGLHIAMCPILHSDQSP